MFEDPYHDPEDDEENEWSSKRISIRFIMYPACLLIFMLGIAMILHPINYKSTSAGIGAICISSYYIYIDLKILFKKKR